mgnify:CR=1 FL=1
MALPDDAIGQILVFERTHGTLVRLRMAPLTRAQILGGKALACFVSIMLVEVILLGVALPSFALIVLEWARFDLVFWLMLVTWSTDIFAYCAGRAIGGRPHGALVREAK